MVHSDIPIRDTVIRNDTAKHYRSIRTILRVQQEEIPESQESVFSASILIGSIVLAVIMLFLAPKAHAACNDPNNLSPELKKAYYELKKASQEMGGFTVSIKC